MASTDLLNRGLPQTFNLQKNSVMKNEEKHNKMRYAYNCSVKVKYNTLYSRNCY